MHRAIALMAAALILGSCAAAWSQEAEEPGDAPEPAAAEPVDPEIAELQLLMEQLGAPPEAQTMLTLLAQGDMDPMVMFMLMAADGGGGMDDDFIGFMLMQKMMEKANKPQALKATVAGGKLLILDDGTLYKIDAATMELEGSVEYRPKKTGDVAGTMAALAPAMARAREKARQATCAANTKQLCLGTVMCCADREDVMPGETWADDIFPYTLNEQILVCPAAEDIPRGYAFNAHLVGVNQGDITAPADTVLILESDLGGDNPLGGIESAAVRHNGGLNLGFADGHVKWVSFEALDNYIWDPFEEQE